MTQKFNTDGMTAQEITQACFKALSDVWEHCDNLSNDSYKEFPKLMTALEDATAALQDIAGNEKFAQEERDDRASMIEQQRFERQHRLTAKQLV